MRVFFTVSIILASFVLPSRAFPAVITVKAGGGADFQTIQEAIDAASAATNDEVHVAAGTYQENVVMKAGVNLMGGYSPSDWSRDIEANVTTIDAGGTGSAVTAANGLIEGFTITGSAADGIAAGLYCLNCSPTIRNNRVAGNGRHGIFADGNSEPVIENNAIHSNSGHGIYCYSFTSGVSPAIYNNTIDGNLNGIVLVSSSPAVRNNIITGSAQYGLSAGVFSGPDHDYDDFRLNAQGDYDGVSGGAHDKYDDPLYVGGGDYRLQASPAMSPCIDAGVDVGLQYVGLPDMGAYESASVQPSPWPPEGLTATPRSAMVKLGWLPNLESDIAGYKVSYGNVPGSYTSTLDAGNVTEYDVRSLINGASYFFAVRAYNTLSNLSDYSDEAGATPTAGTPELPHYDWDGSYGPNCSGCHYRDTGSGELLPQGYDYRYSTALCTSCHNLAGQARAMTVSGQSHPVLVNATTGGNNVPTYGNITGRYSNSMGDNLKPGNIIVCNTCHNMMEKTEDPGRTWELTTRYDGASFDLQRGGWSWYGYMLPEVYSSVSFMPSAPSYIKDRRPMKVSPSRYGYNQAAGRITFSVGFNDYVYVSLRYPYLRVDNTEDVMCLDCHNMGTHQRINCLTCHESHNYENRHGIRPVIKTPNSGIKGVVFKRVTGVNSFADADGLYDGVCQVCHTQTTYFRNDGSGFANHSSGVTYSGSDCSACHTHESGFSKY